MAEEKSQPAPRNSTVAFAVDDAPKSSDKKPKAKKRISKRGSLRSSFFRLKSLAFRKSGGEKGADINTLRGSHGPEFEGLATINRGGGMGISCGCFGWGDDKKQKIILIKGAYCFIFATESDPAPKYAISLAHMKSKIQSPSHGVHHVTIETTLGDVDWELTFEEKQSAQKFVEAFQKQAVIGEADEVRKRLGHENLINKRGSVQYAETIAQKKLKDQPEKKENVLLEDLTRIDPMTAAC